MKSPLYARLLFGASGVLFGIIALLWHDAETWQSMHRILRLPLGTGIGDTLMAALVLASIAIQFSRTARVASIVLAVVYFAFALACIPGIILAPKMYGEYGSLFEQVCLFSGAIAVYGATQYGAARAKTFGTIARIGLGLSTISFTLAQYFYLRLTAGLVPKWIPPNQMFWAVLTTIAFALAAIAILINIRARLAIRSMTLMLVLFGVLVWVPLLIAHPQAHFAWSEFALTMLIAGAAWVVAQLPVF